MYVCACVCVCVCVCDPTQCPRHTRYNVYTSLRVTIGLHYLSIDITKMYGLKKIDAFSFQPSVYLNICLLQADLRKTRGNNYQSNTKSFISPC